jgi:hypothetical protein
MFSPQKINQSFYNSAIRLGVQFYVNDKTYWGKFRHAVWRKLGISDGMPDEDTPFF